MVSLGLGTPQKVKRKQEPLLAIPNLLSLNVHTSSSLCLDHDKILTRSSELLHRHLYIYVTAYKTTALCMGSSSCYALCSPHTTIISGRCVPFEWGLHPATVHAHSSLLPWCHGVHANISWCHFIHHWPKGNKATVPYGCWVLLPRDAGKGKI